MPTVHISLPSKVYEDLKKKAAELGIQVTDLIKLYIRQGLQNGLMPFDTGYSEDSKTLKASPGEIRALKKELHELRKEIMSLKGKYLEAMEFYKYLYERIDTLEEMVIPLMRKKETREEIG
ncbi:MAG: hypothetical protein F7C33_03970 [Desulfurococcales archaeon]|nr:hypothetical protein [Desulfurococcales archaeon]